MYRTATGDPISCKARLLHIGSMIRCERVPVVSVTTCETLMQNEIAVALREPQWQFERANRLWWQLNKGDFQMKNAKRNSREKKTGAVQEVRAAALRGL